MDRFVNSGDGPAFQPIEIGHPRYIGLIDPDTAFWSLVERGKLSDIMRDSELLRAYRKKRESFRAEMDRLRFGLRPSAVYFNITERCNLNCRYCYIPEHMRRNGRHMSEKTVIDALQLLKAYFKTSAGNASLPKIIFHGAEPLLNKKALRAAIEKFSGDFMFGIQTNTVLLDAEMVSFLKSNKVSIGISLDGPTAETVNRTRASWSGEGVFHSVIEAMKLLRGYDAWSAICTITTENVRSLPGLTAFLHKNEVPTCLLNVVRCTLPSARKIKPADALAARYFIKALETSHRLYKESGRKLVVANFANILISILAPTARRLMCDISPCGGGRSFFALVPNGDIFPCSEFIGLKRFKGGNIFKDSVKNILKSDPFKLVTERKVEKIEPCRRCAIRHFCGSPCPAEAYEMNGGMNKTGSFCEFYEEQTRFAFRLIADNRHEAFLWDGWDRGTKEIFNVT
ncbi:MAG: peptide-modifying radical SAM enzyme CbpB [Candidatus Omnitrophica bacterium]|nr:peptide-modifying radical SAM enzyme CbpB [Candidatus Omnitrophota bacterium]